MGPQALVIGAVGTAIGIASRGGGGGGGGGGGSQNVQQIIAQNTQQENELKEKIEKQKQEQKQDIDKLEEESKKNRKELEDEKEKIKKEEELVEQKRKKEEEEKEKQKQEKIKNANEFYQKEKENYFNKKLNEIKNNFNKNTFCLDQVTKLEPYINGKIQKVFSSLDPELKSKVKECYSEILTSFQNIKNPKKKRILLLGITGVGKSTLINAIFDCELAETGFGCPITMNEKPKKYEYNTQPDLELFDSRGIEIDPNYGVEINYNKIKNFINEQFNKNEPLDAIWYCITGTKIEDVEIELVTKLKSLYKDKSLSTVIVYTQSYFEENFIAMKDYLTTKIGNDLIIQNVLAKMKKVGNSIVKSFGLEELLTKTKSLIETNSNLVILSTAKTNTEKKMEDLINERINISNEINFNKIFDVVISSYLGNNDINQETKNLIQEFYSQYYIKCNSIIDENLNIIIEKEAQIMTSDLKNIVTDALLKFDNVISVDQKGFLKENKEKVSELLLNTAKEYGKNNLNSGAKKLIENAIKNYLNKINKEFISSI